MRRIAVVAVVVIVVAGAAMSWPRLRKSAAERAEKRLSEERRYYYSHRADPAFLESELKRRPGNEAILEQLLWAYYAERPDPGKLRRATLEMVERHPGNFLIYHYNLVAFYRRPNYRDEVISALESQLPRHTREADVYANLAQIYEQRSVPPFAATTSDEDKRKWFRYFGLPPFAPVPTRIDRQGVGKAERYYRKAVRLSKGNPFYYSFYSQDLGRLLVRTGQPERAIPVYEAAIRSTSAENAARAHLELGSLYYGQKQFARAKEHYRRAIESDNEERPGKGCTTAHAYTYLGYIALSEKDVVEAERDLLASAQEPKPCCHTTTQGMPLGLAKALMKQGRYDAPKQYLELVLEKFTPNRAEVESLLAQIKRKQ